MKLALILITIMCVCKYAEGQTGSDTTINKKDTAVVLTSLEIYVNDIIIAGNNVTDDDIITREMNTKKGSKLDIEILKEDLQRVYNLGLFTKVDVIPAPIDSNKVNLVIAVEETFYILPIPQGGIKEGEFKKIWVGMNVKLKNFRGRNETLGLSFGVFYEPFVSASYYNPWLGEKAHFFTSANVRYSVNVNKNISSSSGVVDRDSVGEYKVFNFETGFNLGKHITQPMSISGGFSHNIIHLSEFKQDRTLSPEGKDQFTSASIGMSYDTRDLRSFTTYGSAYDIRYNKHGIFNRYHDFNKARADLKRFIPIKLGKNFSITLASRVQTTISFGGTVPTYMLESFGYGNQIRGWNKKVFSGENLLGFYNELRIPIIKPFYISGKDMPIIKKISLLNKNSYKFGLYGTLFIDAGGVWNKRDNFFKTQFKNGYGAGLNIILPFDFVGRMDVAFSKANGKLAPFVTFALDASF